MLSRDDQSTLKSHHRHDTSFTFVSDYADHFAVIAQLVPFPDILHSGVDSLSLSDDGCLAVAVDTSSVFILEMVHVNGRSCPSLSTATSLAKSAYVYLLDGRCGWRKLAELIVRNISD